MPESCCYYGVGRVLLCNWDAWQPSVVEGEVQTLPTEGEQQPFSIYYVDNVPVVTINQVFRDVGEASVLDLNVRTRTDTLPRYDGFGGVDCTTELLEGVDLTLSMDCLSDANLALAFGGSTQSLTSPPQLPSTRNTMRLVPQKPQAVLFEGVNAVGGATQLFFIPKVKLRLAKNRRFLSDDFGQIAITGEVLSAMLPNAIAPGEGPSSLIGWWQETTAASRVVQPVDIAPTVLAIELVAYPANWYFTSDYEPGTPAHTAPPEVVLRVSGLVGGVDTVVMISAVEPEDASTVYREGSITVTADGDYAVPLAIVSDPGFWEARLTAQAFQFGNFVATSIRYNTSFFVP
jgi:hypothetical protein